MWLLVLFLIVVIVIMGCVISQQEKTIMRQGLEIDRLLMSNVIYLKRRGQQGPEVG